jgi:hypothetical protein
MRIALTYAEGRTVQTRVSDELGTALLEVRKHTWHRSHVYELPALAWRRILNELTEKAYGPRGGKAHPSTKSLYAAIAKIADTVRSYELHPAFTEGRGVVGASGETVPAFVSDDGTRSPYPPGRFAMLTPRHINSLGRMITFWEPEGSPGQHPLESEDFHLRFWVEVDHVVPDL